MKRHSLVTRFVLTLVVAGVLGAGMTAFVPSASADCGTNAGGGNCKQARQTSTPADAWSTIRNVLGGLRIYLGL